MKDKVFLSKLAGNLLVIPSIRFQGTGLKIAKGARWGCSLSTETDGWMVRLAKIASYKSTLEIRLDRWPGHKERKLWYGFSSRQQGEIEEFANTLTKEMGKPVILRDDDILQRTPRYKARLKKPLQRETFGKPFLELYTVGGFSFYSVYEFRSEANNVRDLERLTNRVAAFVETAISNLPHSLTSETSDWGIYPQLENRKIVALHLRRERSIHLATLRKEKDNYECQVCGFEFAKKYGVMGQRFAEVHHIIPLSKLSGVTLTELTDLITVCANCHRMLHRLAGAKNDVLLLRKMIAEH